MSAWVLVGMLLFIAMLVGDIIAIRALLAGMVRRRVSLLLTETMRNHTEEVQNIYKEMRGWRHDFHNHIQTMKAFRSLGQNERLDEYLLTLDDDLSAVDRLIKSGNIMADAILNSKLSLAESREIHVKAKAVVPAELNVADIDLCIIIGNLLDNAIEACMKLENKEERFIRVYIDVKRDHLYISITNSSGGKIRKTGSRYLSSKSGFHGLGLMRVDQLIDKYQGYLKRRDEQGVFTSEIMLPIH